VNLFREVDELSFRSERELRDQVALNPQLLEPGLRLYEANGMSGVEFPAGAGLRIDILALDMSNNLVVCELKAGEGQAEAVGQILKYMTWVKLNLCPRHRKVRGLIVCGEITEGLRLASADVPRLTVLRYCMSLRCNFMRGAPQPETRTTPGQPSANGSYRARPRAVRSPGR